MHTMNTIHRALRSSLAGGAAHWLRALLVCLLLLLVPLLLLRVAKGAPALGAPLAQEEEKPPQEQEEEHQPEQNGPEAKVGSWQLASVVEWQSGFRKGLLISNNAGGELRLAAGENEGSFISRPFSATHVINALGAFWRAEIPTGTSLALEVRGRSSEPDMLLKNHDEAENEPGWGPWQEMIAGDARSKADDGALAIPDVLAFPPETRYIQFRARFSSELPRASPGLSEITFAYLNTMQGPGGPAGLPRSPIVFGPDTIMQRPELILRSTWSAKRVPAQPDRARPRGILLHQVHVLTDTVDNVLPLLRAQATYQTRVLGWDDLTYHYLIDEAGTLYEGRMGGPTSQVTRLSGGDDAIQIALIGNRTLPPSEAAQKRLIELMAWLSQAYTIEPTGTHLVGEEYETRQNITGHHSAVPEAPDPGEPLREMVQELRESTDRSIIRVRWYFPEGNVRDYSQRFMFFNPDNEEADVAVALLHEERGEVYNQQLNVSGGEHSSLLLNNIITDTSSLAAIVESNRNIIAERGMQTDTDISIKAGIPELSRIWYFAEGSTDGTFETYLVLFNPHNAVTEAVVSYMRGDGEVAEQKVTISPRDRVVVTVGDVLDGVGFGARIVANRPIAAERTMRFGIERGGMHIGPGISKLSRSWYFAEGTTDPPFSMRLLVLNPNARPSKTTITFMTPDGTSLTRRYRIAPTSRLVVDVNEVVPTLGVATRIEAERPLVAERALYFNPEELDNPPLIANDLITTTIVLTTEENLTPAEADPRAGTVCFGAVAPAYEWRFAYGTTNNARQYLLFSNPGRGQARVHVEFVLTDGSKETQGVVMPAGSRYTLAVHDFYPDEESITATVISTQPIVAERSIYATNGGQGGTTTPGVPKN